MGKKLPVAFGPSFAHKYPMLLHTVHIHTRQSHAESFIIRASFPQMPTNSASPSSFSSSSEQFLRDGTIQHSSSNVLPALELDWTSE